jgi:N-acetylglucosamine-6-phosphate deacetylase
VDFIRKLVESGVTASIGHTAASPEQIRAAVAAGATMSTHLGNGAHLTLPRHPNYLWEQLAADDLAACIIADGFHLPDAVIKVILKVKGRRAMLASDAVHFAGLLPGTYRTPIGGCVVLTPEGRLHLDSNPKLLAGSVRMLADAVGHLARAGLATIGEAWEMASTRPAAEMDLACRKGLAAGAPADLVCFEEHGERLRVVRTLKAGRTVYGS